MSYLYVQGVNIQPGYPEYLSLMKKTIPDAQGNFTFENLAAGTFYVTTMITWYAGNSQQYGRAMRKVTVSGGETKKIVLTE